MATESLKEYFHRIFVEAKYNEIQESRKRADRARFDKLMDKLKYSLKEGDVQSALLITEDALKVGNPGMPFYSELPDIHEQLKLHCEWMVSRRREEEEEKCKR